MDENLDPKVKASLQAQQVQPFDNSEQVTNNPDQQDNPPNEGAQQQNVPQEAYQPDTAAVQDIQTMVSSLPPEANDVDLIEKEWVTHLKSIIDHTNDDPYTQQLEISKAKADYMRKRYNKDIKLTED